MHSSALSILELTVWESRIQPLDQLVAFRESAFPKAKGLRQPIEELIGEPDTPGLRDHTGFTIAREKNSPAIAQPAESSKPAFADEGALAVFEHRLAIRAAALEERLLFACKVLPGDGADQKRGRSEFTHEEQALFDGICRLRKSERPPKAFYWPPLEGKWEMLEPSFGPVWTAWVNRLVQGLAPSTACLLCDEEARPVMEELLGLCPEGLLPEWSWAPGLAQLLDVPSSKRMVMNWLYSLA